MVGSKLYWGGVVGSQGNVKSYEKSPVRLDIKKERKLLG